MKNKYGVTTIEMVKVLNLINQNNEIIVKIQRNIEESMKGKSDLNDCQFYNNYLVACIEDNNETINTILHGIKEVAQ